MILMIIQAENYIQIWHRKSENAKIMYIKFRLIRKKFKLVDVIWDFPYEGGMPDTCNVNILDSEETLDCLRVIGQWLMDSSRIKVSEEQERRATAWFDDLESELEWIGELL